MMHGLMFQKDLVKFSLPSYASFKFPGFQWMF